MRSLRQALPPAYTHDDLIAGYFLHFKRSFALLPSVAAHPLFVLAIATLPPGLINLDPTAEVVSVRLPATPPTQD